MPVLYAGYVAAKQPSALFDVTLAKSLRFAEFSESLTNLHGGRAYTTIMWLLNFFSAATQRTSDCVLQMDSHLSTGPKILLSLAPATNFCLDPGGIIDVKRYVQIPGDRTVRAVHVPKVGE